MIKRIKKIALITLAVSIPIFANTAEDIKNIVTKSKSSFLKSAYSSNLYEPIWINNSGLTPLGKELIGQIGKDKTVSYDLPFFKLYKSVKKDISKKNYSANLDIKMTKLYKEYMSYLVKGGINWKDFDNHIEKLKKKYDYQVGWERVAPPYSVKKILDTAKLNESFNNIFNKVEPKRFKYEKLKKELVKYINIKNSGGWKIIKGNKTLKVGSTSANIPIIRKRLKLVGDLSNCSEPMDSTIYDSCMAKAVKRFKLRHGLKATSTIDKATRVELKRPVSYYIKKMRLNLDRIKWIKRDESRVRIELNIPSFRLYLYDGKDLVTTMRVVVGKPTHPTPIFSDVMTTIVANPYWRIPQSIVRKEMLKKLIKNPHYYEKYNKYLYKGWGADSEKINPATVNWKKYLGNKKHIPYHFMQGPGSRNALGKIKFLFPNKYSVYIHDTPSKKLFFKTTRAFSHGCMRIQKPRELLEALALYNSNIKVDSIMKRLKGDKNKHIGLRKRVPIDIVYLTSFVDDYGNLHFRNDVYGYDRAQLRSYNKSKVLTKKVSKKDSKKNKKNKKNNKKKKQNSKNENKKLNNIKKNSKYTQKQRIDSNIKKAKKEVANKVIKKKDVVVKKKNGYEVVEIGY